MKYDRIKELGEEKFRRLTGVKRSTLKTQVVVDKKTKAIIFTAFSNGKRHDFKWFKESKTRIHQEIKSVTDTGYQGIQKLHRKSELPK